MRFHELEIIYLQKEMGFTERPMYGLSKKEKAEKIFVYNEDGYYECGEEKLKFDPDMQDEVSLGWSYKFSEEDEWLIYDFDEDAFFFANGDGEADGTENCWFLNDIEDELNDFI